MNELASRQVPLLGATPNDPKAIQANGVECAAFSFPLVSELQAPIFSRFLLGTSGHSYSVGCALERQWLSSDKKAPNDQFGADLIG